ncbi:MAG: copper amine oxidase N-terminal domain-containing protein [Clostridiales bacterium]|nr:copper amine oxidase N-terminal domain-containing protein [Clostridiales bacterium]
MSVFLASKIAAVFVLLSTILAQAQAPKSWEEIYKEFMLSAPSSRAMLYDIDADGTPELVSRSPKLAVHAIEGGKAVKKASFEEAGYSFALPADSAETGLYILSANLDKHNCVISKINSDFKIEEVGLIEWNADFNFSTGIPLAETFFLNGKSVSENEFREQSPVGDALSMPFVKSADADATSHAIEALINSYPNQGGNPEFYYSYMQGQGMTYTGMHTDYPNRRFDTFPFPNLNPLSLPENCLLMIDGTLVPEAGLLTSGGERYIPISVAEKKLPSFKGNLKTTSIAGKDYVAASSLTSLVSGSDVSDAYGSLKILAIESKSFSRNYSKDYALDILSKTRKADIEAEQKQFQEQNGRIDEKLENARTLEIKAGADLGRYYVFSIPGTSATYLFNSITGAIYGESLYCVASAIPGLGDLGLRSVSKQSSLNLGGMAVTPNAKPLQIRYANGTLEQFSGEFIGLFLNGNIVKNANVVIENDRCLVPLRLISESLGATVEWDEKSREVAIKDGDHVIRLIIGNLSPTLDGQEIKIDVAPKIIGGYTYVPLRFISESLGCDVAWSDGSDTWPRYMLGIRHAMISRIENPYNTTKENALEDAKYELTYGYGAKYEIYFQDLFELPSSPTQEEKIRHMITNLSYINENDRFFAFDVGNGRQVWIDKLRAMDPLIWKNGEVQTFTVFYKGSKEAMDIFD